MMESLHRVLNDCMLSFFMSTFEISLKCKTDSSVSLTLKHSSITHATCLPLRRRFFFFCSFFLNKDSSFEVSVDDLLDTTRYYRIKTLEVCLQFRTDNRIRRLQLCDRLRGFGLADPCHCFNRTTPTRGYFTPEMHLTSLEVSEIRSGIELKLFGSLL